MSVKNHVAYMLLAVGLLGGCASQWKIQGGPVECRQMCEGWDMELTGMVGVGNQDASGPGATACVCQVRGARGASELGSSGTSPGMAAAVVAIEEAQRQQHAQQHAAATAH